MNEEHEALVRRAAIAEEYAEEEAEAAEAEAAENAAALDVALNLRITRALDARLRALASSEQVPTSALVRRLLTRALDGSGTGLSGEQVEQVEIIARRIAQESVAARK